MTSYTEGEIILKIENVSKDYNGKIVLRNVSATIKVLRVPGTVVGPVVGFVGPSGIGKSTLCRIMAGLDVPTSGKVSLNGFDKPVKTGDVGVVAQGYPLFPNRTVLGNLMLAATKTSKNKKEARDKVLSYLADFDLSAEINHYPCQLSGGQRQRCAIIQQILCGHNNIIMDEPFSGLDPIAKKKTQILIQRTANLNEKNTIIIVSHDIAGCVGVADHIWMMGRDKDVNGKIIPGAYIVETYNLIDRGLAWDPKINTNPLFAPFIQEITDRFGDL